MKFIKHILVFFFVKFPLQIIGIPILAVLLLFIPEDREYLPKKFRWWDNHERYTEGNIGDDSLSGSSHIRNEWSNPTGWLARFYWLALRNPVNYFQYNILGRVKKSPYTLDVQRVRGFSFPSNKTNPKKWLQVGTHEYNTRGWYYQEVTNGDDKLWEFYVIYPLFKKWHFRFRAGWKLGGFYSNKKQGDAIQWVFSMTPLKKIH
tara:strand:+ start:268 stop:879 length:612 start_codon:yes stop_codon:yes gene_type:complete